jgi:FkbM family methyltransferase
VPLASHLKQALRKTPIFPAAKAAQERLSPSRRRDLQRRETFYSDLVTRGDLVFDLGANIGNRTEPFLRLGARVVAVEPQPMCVEVLRHRFARHERFVLADVGVASTPGTTQLHLATNHVTSTMSDRFMDQMSFADSEWAGVVDVRVTTLDALIEVYGVPDFCKIDVEGFESEVLSGLTQALPALSLEYNPDMSEVLVSCLDQLTDLSSGYQARFSPGESMAWDPRGYFSIEEAKKLAAQHELPFGDFYLSLPART